MQDDIRPRLFRFWSHVKIPDGCWEWTASTFETGYGQVKDSNTNMRAHRLMWRMLYGSIPDGMDVLHHCDNPPCVRPDHLFLGVDQDNTDDKVAKRRHGFGEGHPRAKLSDAQVADALAQWAAGEPPSVVARRFDISYPYLWALRKRGRKS